MAGTTAELSAKQRAFVTEYLRDGNATQAAIRAGYSQKTAQEQSSRLLSKVIVRQAVEKARAAIERPKIADAAERREVLTEMFRNAALEPRDRQRASDILNKMDGIYVTKHVGPDGGPIEIATIERVITRPVAP